MSRSNPANGDRDAMFADISKLTGMPFPNLLYRRLGEDPRHLADCWARVRPGLARTAPAALKLLMLGGHDSSGTAAQTGHGPPGGMGSAAHLAPGNSPIDSAQAATLLQVLGIYDSGNSCNAVVVALLLEGTEGDPSSPLVSGPASPRGGLPEKGPDDAPHDGPDAVSIPPMLEVDAMSSGARGSVLRLARLIEPEGRAVPSLFRHFGQDLALLRWVEAELESSVSSGALDRAEGSVRASAAWAASHWPEPVQPLDDEHLRKLLEPFQTMIPRMLATSAVLRTALDRQLP